MNKMNKSGFSLIELLVVITILAIISVVAYTNFSGSTGKAKNSKKLNDITSIETGLQQFYQDKSYYPMPSTYSATTNVWGYDSSKTATTTATFSGTKNGDTISTVSGSLIVGGGKVMDTLGTSQVGAKGVFDLSVFSDKNYLNQELLDPSLKDIKVGNNNVFMDYGIGKYIYGVSSKPAAVGSWNTNGKKGQAYNIAITLTDDQKTYLTKVYGSFDKNSCTDCPNSLIGSATTTLMDGNSYSGSEVSNSNITIPYPVEGF